MDFSTTLLREKFVIHETRGDQSAGQSLTAVSNRLVVPLHDIRGKAIETFVVRAQTMHSCVRMAAKILQTYIRSGPILARDERFDFAAVWDALTEDHEQKFNPNRWIAIYSQGKIVYAEGEHHAFLDMIEKCDSRNPGNYDEAVHLAERAFATIGRTVTIAHDANIGLVTTVKDGYGKCGLILRNPNRRTTFSFTAKNKGENTVTGPQSMIVGAAFLEGIQLAFQIGTANEKLRLGKIARYCPEDRLADSGRRRLGRLNAEIRTFENNLEVYYRPEKPEFSQIVVEAEAYYFNHHKDEAETEAEAEASTASDVKSQDDYNIEISGTPL